MTRVTHEGKAYYFSAVACREAFTKAPERYVMRPTLGKKGAA